MDKERQNIAILYLIYGTNKPLFRLSSHNSDSDTFFFLFPFYCSKPLYKEIGRLIRGPVDLRPDKRGSTVLNLFQGQTKTKIKIE